MSEFYQYLLENVQAGPIQTAVLDLYALYESAMEPSDIVIPAQHRPTVASMFNDAIQRGNINPHALTGSKRYSIQNNTKFKNSHEKAELIINDARVNHTQLDIVPILYQKKRYLACIKCTDDNILLLVSSYANYPPRKGMRFGIKTFYMIEQPQIATLYKYLMDNPNPTQLPDNIKEIIYHHQSGGLHKPTEANPYKYIELYVKLKERLQKTRDIITEITDQIGQYKNIINAPEDSTDQNISKPEAKWKYVHACQRATELGTQSKRIQKQLNTLMDEYKKQFNQSLTGDYGLVKLGKTLRWYEPSEPPNETPSNVEAPIVTESISIPESLCREAHEYIAATRGWRPDQAKRLYPANRDWLQSNASTFLSAYDATQDIASAVSAINLANGHPVTSRF